MRRIAGWVLAVLVVVVLSSGVAKADALHGVCLSPTPACSDNGTVTPVTSQTPTYGFTISPGPQTGGFVVVTLIPDNLAGAGSESFSVNGTPTVLEGQWTSGSLQSFFNFSATPANPIDAFLPTTQVFDSGATGYDVYVALLPTVVTLTDPSNPSGTFSLSDGTFVLPLGTSIVGFFEANGSSDIVATAPSGQLSIQGTSVPEPGSLALLGTGLLSMAGILRRRKS